jgi:FSR family fosmidomycin resistance protein-like MFS transporter
MPFSVFVVLGQDYLPNRIGTASGVTVGLAVSVGGLFTPVFGWVADRSGRVTTIRWGLAVIPPAMVGMLIAPNLAVAFPLVALVGVTTFMPFSVFVVLGQDYLPNRIGTASGVTVGLAVSVGGLFTPVFGWIADATSLQTTFWLLIVLPVLGLALSMRLRAPARTGTASTGEDVATTGSP